MEGVPVRWVLGWPAEDAGGAQAAVDAGAELPVLQVGWIRLGSSLT